MKHFISIILLFVAGIGFAQSTYPQVGYLQPKDSVAIMRVIHKWDNENWAECLKAMSKLPKGYLSDGGILWLKGVCHYYMENYSQALNFFSMSMAAEPGHIAVYYDRGHTHLKLDQYAAAAADFGAYLVYNPEDEQTSTLLAYSLAEAGQVDLAITHFSSISHNDTLSFHLLGELYLQYKEEYAQAVDWFDKLLKLAPNHLEGLERAAIAHSYLYNHSRCLELIDKLIELIPEYGRAYFLKGYFLDEMGRELQAEEYFEKARELGYTWDEGTEEY
jgi:tetratricopeptide (TPR) repeat protein